MTLSARTTSIPSYAARAFARGGLGWPVLSALVYGFSDKSAHFLPGALLGLVPLFVFLRDASDGRKILKGCFLYSVCLYSVILSWLFDLAEYSWMVVFLFMAMILYLSLFTSTFALLTRRTVARTALPFAAVAPVYWIAIDLLRWWSPFGFPPCEMQAALLGTPVLIQCADLLGISGVTLTIVLANALATDLFLLWRDRRDARSRPGGGASAVGARGRSPGAAATSVRPATGSRAPVLRGILLAAGFALSIAGPAVYGVWRIRTIPLGAGPRIAVVQPNPSKAQRTDKTRWPELWEKLERLTREAAAGAPALIVWPEGSVPNLWVERPGHPEELVEIKNRLSTIVSAARVPFVAGALYLVWDTPTHYDIYNAALMLDRTGRLVGAYEKNILVPFTEADPVRGFDRLLGRSSRSGLRLGGLTRGRGTPLYDLGSGRFGVMICYEQLDPGIARQEALDGADFLVSITNDSWFERSFLQHWLASMAIFRAVEARRPLVRAALTGVSELIDPLGRVQESAPAHEEAVLSGALLLGPPGRTFYTRYAGWIHASMLALAGLLLALSFVRRPGRSQRSS